MIGEAALLLALLALLKQDLRRELDGLADDELTVEDWQVDVTRLVTRYSTAALLAGLDADALTDGQEEVVADAVREQLPYLKDFAAEIADSKSVDDWDSAWAERTELYAWAIVPVFWEGVAQAEPDRLYVFDGEDGLESCPDCQRFKTEPHTLRWYLDNDFLPAPGCALECGGWRCQHYPVPAT